MTHWLRPVVVAAALAAAGPAAAQTVQASSTTMLLARQDFRLGPPGRDTALHTAVPLFEILRVDASDIKTRYAELEVALSTWGSFEIASENRFWQNGASPDDRLTGDVNVGYIRALLLDRRLTLQAGRMLVADGAARMVQLDGAEARAVLPYGLGVSAYVGSPVAPRFTTRGGELAVGNITADFAAGGRLAWRAPGLLEVGASVGVANDHGEYARRDLGLDLRATPHRRWVLTSSGWFSLLENRVGEANVGVTYLAARGVELTAEYRHAEPDLFLPRTSILSVFVADKRDDVGGRVHYGALRNLVLDLDYHALIQDQGTGHWLRGKGVYRLGREGATSVGAELALLKNNGVSTMNDNGYKEVRVFAAREFVRQLLATLDLSGYFYDQDVNGQSKSLVATATLAYPFARGWTAALAGTAATTPFLESQLEMMAKIAYGQTYVARQEVE